MIDPGYGVLLERIIDQNDVIIENMGEMRDLVRRIPFIEAKVLEHDAKFDIVIKAIKDLSRQVAAHEVLLKEACNLRT